MKRMLTNRYIRLITFGVMLASFSIYLGLQVPAYYLFLLVLLFLVKSESRITVLAILLYSLLFIPAFIMTFLLRIEYFSLILFSLFSFSFLGIFFWKKVKILLFIPLILFCGICGLFFFLNQLEPGEVCSYATKGDIGNCECDGLILNTLSVGYCQGDRISCTVSPSHEPILCTDHVLPDHFLGK